MNFIFPYFGSTQHFLFLVLLSSLPSLSFLLLCIVKCPIFSLHFCFSSLCIILLLRHCLLYDFSRRSATLSLFRFQHATKQKVFCTLPGTKDSVLDFLKRVQSFTYDYTKELVTMMLYITQTISICYWFFCSNDVVLPRCEMLQNCQLRQESMEPSAYAP